VKCEPEEMKEPKLRLEIKPLIAIDSKESAHNATASFVIVSGKESVCYSVFIYSSLLCETRRRRKRISK